MLSCLLRPSRPARAMWSGLQLAPCCILQPSSKVLFPCHQCLRQDPLNEPLPTTSRFGPQPQSAPDGPTVGLQFADASGRACPAHRLVGKQPLPGSADSVSSLRAHQGLVAVSQAAKALLAFPPVPFRTAAALIVSSPDLWEAARCLPARLGVGEVSRYLLFGWYKHGGLTGITAITDTVSGVVGLLNALLAQADPQGGWTTLALFSSVEAEPHVDRRNLKITCNYVLPLALPCDEPYLWVQNPLHSGLSSLTWLGKDGRAYPGFRLPLQVGIRVSCIPCLHLGLPLPLSRTSCLLGTLCLGWTAQVRQLYVNCNLLGFDWSAVEGESAQGELIQGELVLGEE